MLGSPYFGKLPFLANIITFLQGSQWRDYARLTMHVCIRSCFDRKDFTLVGLCMGRPIFDGLRYVLLFNERLMEESLAPPNAHKLLKHLGPRHNPKPLVQGVFRQQKDLGVPYKTGVEGAGRESSSFIPEKVL